MDAEVTFEVEGIPVPQGSKTGYVVGKRAVLVDANKATLKPWRQAVMQAAVAAHAGRPPFDEPLAAVLEFRFVRPASVKRAHPAVKPDIDKLARSIFDALTDAGVVRDDSRIVRVEAVKVYADLAGVRVRVGRYMDATPEEGKQ